MNKNKIYTLCELNDYLLKINKNHVIGFTNGCFDLLHNGHITLLSEAKNKCDFLVVALNSDSSIKKLKGNCRPIDDINIRIEKISKREEVDAIIIFEEDTPLSLIKSIVPNILFKGADYKDKDVVGKDFMLDNGGSVEFINILSGFSTTNIIKNSGI